MEQPGNTDEPTVRMSSPESERTTVPMHRPSLLGRVRAWRATRRKVPWKRRARRWVWRILTFACTLLGLGLLSFAALIVYYGADLPRTRELGRYEPAQVTRIVARDGTLLAELFVERRTVVPIAEVPKVMKRAVVAAEDANFYQHEGLDYLGILRALLTNLRSGRARQGGSTITQQVIKNILLTPERSFARKIRELILARRIEQELTKDQILELYLNRIYFGHGRYGVEEAAQYYFGKSVRDVSLAEAATLAGLVKGPSIYSPRVDLARAKERQRYVLEQMADKGLAPRAEVQAALREGIRLAPPPETVSELAPEAVTEVERVLVERVGERARRGGYTVTTTIDPAMQSAAREAVRANLDDYGKRHGIRERARGPQSALVALDVDTGEVLAIVGGHDMGRGDFDRARSAHRQPGSAFKPLVYSYAIHSRTFTAASILETNPAKLGNKYRPGNYDESEGQAPSRLRDALAHSVNVAAVWTLERLGPGKVVAWAKTMGIESKLGADLSLALGAYEMTPLELAGAYATFASGGIFREPVIIRSVVTATGEEVSIDSAKPRRVMDEAEAYVTTSLLRSVVEYGTGKRARALGYPVAGKTGTSNAAKDAWFAGYSSEVVCVVWTGFDNAAPLGRGETGAITSLPAFVRFMQAAHKTRPGDFAPPSTGLVRVAIDPVSGKLASSGGIDEVFLAGTEPTELADPPSDPLPWPF